MTDDLPPAAEVFLRVSTLPASATWVMHDKLSLTYFDAPFPKTTAPKVPEFVEP